MNMVRINRLFELLALSNLWLSLGIAVTGCSVPYILGFQSSTLLLPLIFFMTFSLYTLNRLTDEEEDAINNPKRRAFFSKYGREIFLSAASMYAIALILCSLNNIASFVICITVLLLGVSYSVEWVPKKLAAYLGFKRFKDPIVIKNSIIALTWSITMVLLPIYFNSSPFTLLALLVFMFIFLRGIVNTVFFDMRDVEGDKINRVRTIPVVLGIKKTKLLLLFFNTLIGLILLYGALISPKSVIFYTLNISTVYSYLYIYLHNRININFLCDTIVDGEFILIGTLALLGHHLSYF